MSHGGLSTASRRNSAEQIIRLLRQADVEPGRGRKVPEVCKTLGIHEVTCDRWRREYGGLKVDHA
ncbi:transposase [Leptolyngbya sp. 15MV]|nr:transposase [Leptolyngbya sp. 15MV]